MVARYSNRIRAMAQAQTSFSYDGSLCAGHLLVWTWRKLIGGRGECPVIAREYDRFAGLEADALLAAFATFLMLLGRSSRRVPCLGPPIAPDFFGRGAHVAADRGGAEGRGANSLGAPGWYGVDELMQAGERPAE